MSSSSARKMTGPVLFLLFAGSCTASVIPIAQRVDVSQIRVQDELGQYHFAHAGGPNSRSETRTADGITSGGYSYVDANGIIQSAAYVSDPVNGFRVAATNLPAGPAVPAGPALVAAAAPAVVPAAPALVPAAPAVVPAAPSYVVAAPSIVPASPAFVAPALDVLPAAPAPAIVAPVPAVVPPAPVADKDDSTESGEPSTEVPDKSEESGNTSAPEEPSSSAEPAGEEPSPINPYVPVQDTVEVIAARQQHLTAFEETKARDAAEGTEEPHVEPTETPEAPLPTEAPSTPLPEASSQAPPPLIPAALPAVRIAGPLPAVPLAPLGPVAAVAAPGVARVAAVAAPSVAAVSAPVVVGAPLVSASQFRVQDELGQFAFGHAGGPNSREEVSTADGITRGSYAYIDGNGLVQNAAYVSDPVNGFRVAASNLPVQPAPTYLADSQEVAEAKAALYKAQQDHIAKL